MFVSALASVSSRRGAHYYHYVIILLRHHMLYIMRQLHIMINEGATYVICLAIQTL